MKKYFQCVACQEKYPFSKDILTCKNHSPYYGYLTTIYDYKNIKLADETNVWKKYKDLFPVSKLTINFDEQKTPLIKLNNLGKKYGFLNLYAKDESKNPTGSFKDRGSIFTVNTALAWGIQDIFVVSSGNAAASITAYAQKAGIRYTCYVPKNLSVGKRLLINLYKGKIKEASGNYEEIYRHAIDTPYPGWNCTPGINPINEEGIKIIGFELFEELDVPDTIIMPCGNGTLLFGIYKAFKELTFLGLTNKLPQLIGVQIKNAAPLKGAYEQKKDFVRLPHIPNSIAEGIIAEESYSSPKVMRALEDSKGYIVEVTDKEVTNAMGEVIRTESLIPEPTSATVYAALKKVKLKSSEKIVLMQTAGGIKNLKEIMQIFIKM